MQYSYQNQKKAEEVVLHLFLRVYKNLTIIEIQHQFKVTFKIKQCKIKTAGVFFMG